MRPCFCLCLGLLLGVGSVAAQEQTNLDPHAQQVLRSACQYLAQSSQFTLSAEIWREHVAEDGQKVQFSRTVTMAVKRPNQLYVEIRAPFSDRRFWYEGKSLTLLDQRRNFFGTAPMPATLDAMLDTAHDQFGIDLPLIDVALSDPFTQATAKVQQGKYYAVAPVLGVPCHHLAFIQDNIDWQIWIEEGPQPLIRKFVITHKHEEGAPEFTALITHWNLSDRIPDSTFQFQAPPGATRIDMRQVNPVAADHPPQTAPAIPKEKE